MKTEIRKLLRPLVRRLDRGWLRITNPIREIPLGYIESAGRIVVLQNGIHSIENVSVDCLGRAIPFDLSGPTLRIGGHDTGIVLGIGIDHSTSKIKP